MTNKSSDVVKRVFFALFLLSLLLLYAVTTTVDETAKKGDRSHSLSLPSDGSSIMMMGQDKVTTSPYHGKMLRPFLDSLERRTESLSGNDTNKDGSNPEATSEVTNPTAPWWFEPAGCPDELWWFKRWAKRAMDQKRSRKQTSRHSTSRTTTTSSTTGPTTNSLPLGLTLVDVGANKGYTIASWLAILADIHESSSSSESEEEILNPSSSSSLTTPPFSLSSSSSWKRERYPPRNITKDLTEAAVQAGMVNFCGACCDCEDLLDYRWWSQEESSSRSSPNTSLKAGMQADGDYSPRGFSHKIFGFEPLPANFAFLSRFFDALSKKSSVKRHKTNGRSTTSMSDSTHTESYELFEGLFSLELQKLAVGNTPRGVVQFANVSVGAETGRILSETKAAGSTNVLTTKKSKRAAGESVDGSHDYTRQLAPQGKNGITDKSSSSSVGVHVTSLDRFFSLRHLSIGSTTAAGKKSKGGTSSTSSSFFIDILLTDTEGHDSKVFAGAEKILLSRHLIGIYIMELWSPPEENLAMLTKLSSRKKYNFQCYFPLQRTKEDVHAVRKKRRGVKEGESQRFVDRYLRFEHYLELNSKGSTTPPSGALFGLRGWYNAICIHRQHNPDLIEEFEEEIEKGSPSTKEALHPSKFSHRSRCAPSSAIYFNQDFNRRAMKELAANINARKRERANATSPDPSGMSGGGSSVGGATTTREEDLNPSEWFETPEYRSIQAKAVREWLDKAPETNDRST